MSGARSAVERRAGPLTHRVVELRARFRSDQHNRRVDGRGRRDRGGPRNAPQAEPPAIPGRSGLLAGGLDRRLRPRVRYGEAGPDLHRAGDRSAGAARHHQHRRRAGRRSQRARPCRPRPHRGARAPRRGRRYRRARQRHLPRSQRRVVADRRCLSVGCCARQVEGCGSGGCARSRLCVQRDRLAGGAACRPPALGHHRAPWRAVDSLRRHRRLRQGNDGSGDQDSPYAGTGVVDRGGPPARLDGRRHVGMGHGAAARRAASL